MCLSLDCAMQPRNLALLCCAFSRLPSYLVQSRDQYVNSGFLHVDCRPCNHMVVTTNWPGQPEMYACRATVGETSLDKIPPNHFGMVESPIPIKGLLSFCTHTCTCSLINVQVIHSISSHVCLLFYIQTLLGTYVCTATPGEFMWLPGVLTQVSNTFLINCRYYILVWMGVAFINGQHLLFGIQSQSIKTYVLSSYNGNYMVP